MGGQGASVAAELTPSGVQTVNPTPRRYTPQVPFRLVEMNIELLPRVV